MNANATGFRLGPLLGRVRRMPAALAGAAQQLVSQAMAGQQSSHSRLGKWETLVSPAARAAMWSMQRQAAPVANGESQ